MPKRKRRTRQHVIADLSANYFEYFVLQWACFKFSQKLVDTYSLTHLLAYFRRNVNYFLKYAYLQAYFEQKGVSLPSNQKTFTIYFDRKNIVSQDAVKKWQTYKNRVLAQIDGRIIHYA